MTTEITPIASLQRDEIIAPIAGELMESSQRIYGYDAEVFATWLQEKNVTPESINEETMIAYRGYLLSKYASATARRMFSVACRLLGVQVGRHVLKDNPAKNVRGIKAHDESKHIALTKEEARALLSTIDRTTYKGLRDYALLSVLLRTGLRRFEASALNIGDLSMSQGHHILFIQAGKGGERATVKLPVDVWRDIMAYLEAIGRSEASDSTPLFVRFLKGENKWSEKRLSANGIYYLVLDYAKKAQIKNLTPHGMRASFITLAIEGGASLTSVQYAARHKQPQTTEIYHKRKLNLDQNAVDFINL
jgi:integrase/recombinase XerD